jgi:serine/threonine protein kinase
MVGHIVSHYRVLTEFGSGGMGVVYRAEDTRLGRHVALKLLSAHLAVDRVALERFHREARAASALNHPHICTIYDIDEADGRPFVAMELLDGDPLRMRLAHGRLAVSAIVELTAQLTDALESAQAKGIVHRDIKPENIFVTTRGTAKVSVLLGSSPRTSRRLGVEMGARVRSLSRSYQGTGSALDIDAWSRGSGILVVGARPAANESRGGRRHLPFHRSACSSTVASL